MKKIYQKKCNLPPLIMRKMFSQLPFKRKTVTMCTQESDQVGKKGSRAGEDYVHVLKAWRTVKLSLTLAGVRFYLLSNKPQSHSSLQQQAAAAQELLSGWKFPQGSCVFVTNDPSLFHTECLSLQDTRLPIGFTQPFLCLRL